ncbi:MAG: Uma2 family endonuclease [Dehalococcoidia bacterium]
MVLEAPARPVVPANPYGDPCRPFTIEDWWTMPDDGNRYEFLDGVLIVMPSPSFEHQRVTLRIAAALLGFADKNGGDAFVAPLGVALSEEHGFQPDAGYISAERGSTIVERGIEGAPDLVVEVASPSTSRYDRRTKLPAYFDAGVREVWLVDPEARTVTVATPSGEAAVAFGAPIPSGIVEIGAAELE